MSGAKNGLDVMSAEETALLDSMRDDDASTPEVVETATEEAPDASEGADLELEEAADSVEPHDEPVAGQPRSKATQRVHQALERQRAAEAKAQQAEAALQTEKAVTQERMRLLMEAATAASAHPPVAAPAVEIPDINTDPVGHFNALLVEEQRKRADLEAIVRGFSEQQRAAQAQAEMRDWVISQEQQFMATEPTYIDGTKFLVEGRRAELTAIGITDPLEQKRIIDNDIVGIAMKSRQDGVNFGERVFKTAVARGFKAAPKETVIPPIDSETPLPDRAARIENGRENATTISNVGARTAPALSPERISNMSEAQFEQVYNKVKGNPAALRQLMGH